MAINGASEVEEIFDRFFGFLQRRTDVYHTMICPEDYNSSCGIPITEINNRGFPPGHIRRLVCKTFDKYSFKYINERQPYIMNDGVREKYTNFSNIIIPQNDVNRPNEINVRSKSDQFKGFTNTYNGGVTEYYAWSQSMNDITIEIDCKQIVTKDDIMVKITPTRLEVNTPKFNINDIWCKKIIGDNEFNWYIQDRRIIVISVDKVEEGWWDRLLEGDERIDTQKIESVKKLSELDEKTQHFICNQIMGKN